MYIWTIGTFLCITFESMVIPFQKNRDNANQKERCILQSKQKILFGRL